MLKNSFCVIWWIIMEEDFCVGRRQVFFSEVYYVFSLLAPFDSDFFSFHFVCKDTHNDSSDKEAEVQNTKKNVHLSIILLILLLINKFQVVFLICLIVHYFLA